MCKWVCWAWPPWSSLRGRWEEKAFSPQGLLQSQVWVNVVPKWEPWCVFTEDKEGGTDPWRAGKRDTPATQWVTVFIPWKMSPRKPQMDNRQLQPWECCFLPKQALWAERSSWWSKARLIWGWCWGFKVFRVVNAAKKNQQGSRNQPFPPEQLYIPRLPQNVSHHLPLPPRLWHASRGGRKFHGLPRMPRFCDLALWLCLSDTKFEVPSTLCPFLPSTHGWAVVTSLLLPRHLLHWGQGSEGDLLVLQLSFLCWASN